MEAKRSALESIVAKTAEAAAPIQNHSPLSSDAQQVEEESLQKSLRKRKRNRKAGKSFKIFAPQVGFESTVKRSFNKMESNGRHVERF